MWSDALMVAVPARHPLLKHKRIPLEEVLRYPLVLCDPQVCEGHARQVERVLRRVDMEPLIAERVETEGELRVIREMGVEGVQGQLVGEPAPWK
jgi:DNA-binding transcriptional LysR family regulator